MGNFSLILSNLGVAPKRFEPSNSDLVSSNSGPFPQQDSQSQPQIAQSYLGTPIIDQVVLSNGAVSVVLDSVIVTITMQKNIVKTSINGRSGTIKEYMSEGDFAVVISGAIYGQANDYPEQQVQDLAQILRHQGSIKCTSNFLNFFGVYEIVIEGFSLPQAEGFTNSQPLDIQAISDYPIELLVDV
jgi:hypothetical protein